MWWTWFLIPAIPVATIVVGDLAPILWRRRERPAKPPAGYAQCPKRCGRYTPRGTGDCFGCRGIPGGGAKTEIPDWAPPAVLCRACCASCSLVDEFGTCYVCRGEIALEIEEAINPWPALEARQ